MAQSLLEQYEGTLKDIGDVEVEVAVRLRDAMQLLAEAVQLSLNRTERIRGRMEELRKAQGK